jgi:hypothetical protein
MEAICDGEESRRRQLKQKPGSLFGRVGEPLLRLEFGKREDWSNGFDGEALARWKLGAMERRVCSASGDQRCTEAEDTSKKLGPVGKR